MSVVLDQQDRSDRERALIASARAQLARRRGDSTTALTAAPPAPDLSLAASCPPPDSFSGYDIIREVHRGGQGVVYQAIQKSTRRKVALKVLKSGAFVGSTQRTRFEREVQILAQLHHPNIVAIHDSGVISGGDAFLVMDYISGQPLDEYIATNCTPQGDVARSSRADPRPLLELFAKICDAVNSAHLRGVIHRDLKPGNIVVDTNGEPHVLDFGLAKLVLGDISDENRAPVISVTGQFIGSLPWASPEQAEGQSGRIDIRTDVYSLGVILYHMLAGQYPYPVTVPVREALDHIVKTEPTRPSSIRRDIDDELETIMLKCLSKERDRRYQSAGELARDVRRYLAGEPIEAKRDSLGYLLRKQLRKYRVAVAAGSCIFVMMIAALVVSLTFWHQAAAERDDAMRARAREQHERKRAETNEQQARAEVAKLAAVHRFFQKLLAHADPTVTEARARVEYIKILESTAKDVEGSPLGGDPELRASVETVLGCTYWAIGDFIGKIGFDRAERHLKRALRIYRGLHPEPHADTVRIMGILSNVYMAQKDNKSKLAQGERQLTEALAMKRLLVGAEHAEIATGLFNMGDFLRHCDRLVEAEQPLKDAYAMRSRVFGPQHKDTIHSAGALADLLMDLRRYAEAEPLHRLELEFRRADREAPEYELYLAASLRSVGTDLLYQNKFAEAEPLLRESLELRDKVLKPRDRRRFQSMTLLGGALAGMGRFDDARKLLQDGYDGLKTATGARQHHWREATEMMARYYDYTGQPQAADEWRAKLAKYGAAEPNDDNGER